MRANRREFLTAGLAPGVASWLGSSAQVAEPRVCLALASPGTSSDMPSIFRELGLGVDVIASVAIASADPDKHALLWFQAPSYPEPAALPGKAIAHVQRFLEAGRGVLAEFVTNFPGAPAYDRPQKTGVARLFVSSALDGPDALPAGTILDEHDSYSLPLRETPRGAREILAFGRVAGVQRIIPNFEPSNAWPGLLAGVSGNGRFALSLTSISEFRRRQYAPLAHWEKFLRDLALSLLSPAERGRVLQNYVPLRVWSEPRRWVVPGTTFQILVETSPGARVEAGGVAREQAPGRYTRELKVGLAGPVRVAVKVAGKSSGRAAEFTVRVADRSTAYRRALARNIRWFERSGALLRPDGSLGVAEWISGPDVEGNRIPFGAEQVFSPERADCVFESALAFWLYGKAGASARHLSIGKNMLVHIMDFQRLEQGDKGYGLWNTRGRGGPAFQDDVSWATICSLAGYRYLNDPIFLHRGVLSARAQLDAFGQDDRLRVPQFAKPSAGNPLTQKVDEHPHSGGCVLAAWLYTYGMTGEEAYLNAARPILDATVESFPKIRRYIISRTCEASRFLLPLSLAYYYTDEPRYKQALWEQAEYLRARTAPCGAIREDGSNTGDRVEGGDLGLTYDSKDTISDQLYTTSFAAMNFWIAYKATGDQSYLQDFYRIADYLVRIQIESPDPSLNGGWMRGFDYSLWEYYGANADQAWNAYCLETGWQNAIIDIALALYLTGDTFFEPKKT